MYQWIGSALVQIMTCRQAGAKPLSAPMVEYCLLDPKEHTSLKVQYKFKHSLSRKCAMAAILTRPQCVELKKTDPITSWTHIYIIRKHHIVYTISFLCLQQEYMDGCLGKYRLIYGIVCRFKNIVLPFHIDVALTRWAIRGGWLQ